MTEAVVEVQASPWNPELTETLYDLLYGGKTGPRGLDAALRRLEQQHGNHVYVELIHLLSHLRFTPQDASGHWKAILEHRDRMGRSLGKEVDLRVALLSYFVEVNRHLHNPKIIELKLFEQTQASIYRDELTGLYNFRYFREYLVREIQRGERHVPPLSLVMVDIDNFKLYNDRNGHEAGNEALATIAGLLNESIRKTDVAARYGGEEFVLVLPSTPKTHAHDVAERAREKIESRPFPHEECQPNGHLTVSLGLATYPADARSADDLVRCADAALYGAKERGKNRVFLFGENRRSYRRISAALNGRYCVVAAEYYPLKTVNLGEGGILFVVEQKLPVGSLIDISLDLPGSNRSIVTSGRVIRVEENRDGVFEAAIRIIEIGARDQTRLVSYLRKQGLCLNEESPQDAAKPTAAAKTRRRRRTNRRT
ncbi:MAG: diguanylate cyclase [Acidobacteria bacterium]|nr:diguanylate cyclase [Acidobacteriota bacterium]